ncbi:DUF1376 domain-containing protein [Paraburkholderia sp. BL17N1]|uniref:DUF1376 domain-containing protein n=1 Tax=Paraburkholderia sp. BL17N1 TaxID=1938798 RepID=UPI000EB53BA3|nr:DUF1376 domain-containing protein [Paraburkholderia sp. BL17N1]RKR46285.1 uncharacterized protein DUF1376 [Paraburkholderia sp. BL17N1]
MIELPSPLTPIDCNLQDFAFMPVDVKRMLSSETWILGTGDERAAAITLWLESWHQVPAASLPDNDRMLEHLSKAKAWKRVKEHALRGWEKCTDGRLYHRVVAEKVLEAWIEKLLNSLSGSAGNAKRWGIDIDTVALEGRVIEAAQLLTAIAPQSKTLRKKQVLSIVAGSPPDPKKIAPRSPDSSPPDSPPDSAEDRNRQGQGQGHTPPIGGDAVASQPTELPPGLTAEEAVFQIAVPWLVERGVPDRNARSLMGAARKQLGDDSAWELARQFMRDKPVEPAAWISAAINARMKPGGAGRPNRQEDLEARNRTVAARLAQEGT